jgi:ATP-dependent DNA ligase
LAEEDCAEHEQEEKQDVRVPNTKQQIVSKRLSAPYRSGRSTEWLKIKNPNSAAMVRHREDRW